MYIAAGMVRQFRRAYKLTDFITIRAAFGSVILLITKRQ
jgi:hypothetical protein